MAHQPTQQQGPFPVQRGPFPTVRMEQHQTQMQMQMGPVQTQGPFPTMQRAGSFPTVQTLQHPTTQQPVQMGPGETPPARFPTAPQPTVQTDQAGQNLQMQQSAQMHYVQTQQPMGMQQQVGQDGQVILVQPAGGAMPSALPSRPPVFEGVNADDFGIASNDTDSFDCRQPCIDSKSVCCICARGYYYVPADYRNPSKKYVREAKCCSNDWVVPDAMIYGRRVRIEANSGEYCCGFCQCHPDIAVLDYETRAVLGSATTIDGPGCCSCPQTYPDAQALDPDGTPVGETVVFSSCECCEKCCLVCMDRCCPESKGCCNFCTNRSVRHRGVYRANTLGESEIGHFNISERYGCLSQFYPRRYGLYIPMTPESLEEQETMRWPMVALTHLLGMKYNIAQ